MTTFRWYMLGLALLFGAYVAVEYYRPKPLDWTPTLENDDKIPYGTFALYDLLPTLMRVERADVRTVRVPVYSQIEGVDEEAERDDATTPVDTDDTEAEKLLEQISDADSTATAQAPTPTDSATTTASSASLPNNEQEDADYASGLEDGGYKPATYLFVAKRFELTQLDCRSLLRHVARGNDVFIAAESFDTFFADTLGFTSTEYAPVQWKQKGSSTSDSVQVRITQAGKDLLTDSVRLLLTNPVVARQTGRASFALPAVSATSRLVAKSTLTSKAALLAADDRNNAVLLRIPHGRGHVYVCSVPLAFSNYFMLQARTGNFAFAALSYLPTGRTVWWDEYQKQGRRGEQSLLRVLLDHEALRTAVYLTLVASLLFVLFEVRRKQRIIPILKPLPNTTLLFTRTVAGLYRQGNNHALIAEKKISLFLEHLRTRYHEPGLDLTDDATRERIAQKSGVPRVDVDALVRRINFALTAPQISDAELLALNKALNAFRKSST